LQARNALPPNDQQKALTALDGFFFKLRAAGLDAACTKRMVRCGRTATPMLDSNVIFHVGAQANEDMAPK